MIGMHACTVAVVTDLPQLQAELSAGECIVFQQNAFSDKRKCCMQVGEGVGDAGCALCAAAS